MRVAVSATIPGLSTSELAGLCGWAEEIGYREAWVSEVAGPSAFVLATAAALKTQRMDVGIAVIPAYNRTPALIALSAGSVSQVLDGRSLHLGIGSSSETIVTMWNGLPFTKPVVRVRETVQAVRSALRGDGTYDGSQVAMTRFKMTSPPAGPVPVWVGALGPKMLKTAGEHGDGVCLNLMSPEVVPRQLTEVGHGLARSGRTLDEFGVMARLWVLITGDGVTVRRSLAGVLAAYLAQPVYNRFLAWSGYPEEAAAIAKAWAARDRDAMGEAVHDGLVRAITTIGTESEVRAHLDGYREAGIGVAAFHVASSQRSEIEDTLRRLAPRSATGLWG